MSLEGETEGGSAPPAEGYRGFAKILCLPTRDRLMYGEETRRLN